MKRLKSSGWFVLGLAAAAVPLQGAVAADAADIEMGRKLFTQGATPPCAICHTLQDAKSSGMVGPVLDEIKPDADRVAKALRNGLGQMPSYQATLTEAQILALARYVSKVAGSQ